MVFFPENRGAPPVRLVDSSSESRPEKPLTDARNAIAKAVASPRAGRRLAHLRRSLATASASLRSCLLPSASVVVLVVVRLLRVVLVLAFVLRVRMR